MKDQMTRQKVEHLSLVLSYPDGESAEFYGSDLYADVKFQTPDFPLMDVQDVFSIQLSRPQVSKLTIEVTLGLNGHMSVQIQPAPGGGS